jgi:Domain of unknown function (DUF3303)
LEYHLAASIPTHTQQEKTMKFMVNWSIYQESWLPVLDKWTSLTPEERADTGAGVTLVGRWHDLGSRTGVAIVETSDAAALARYLGEWNPHMDLDVSPVLDDEEAAKAGKAILDSQRG